MNFKHTLLAGLFIAGTALFAVEGKFDAKTNSISWGTKKLTVKPNGTFKVTSQDHTILDFSFCTGTPYAKNSIGNSSLKAPKKYDGGAFCLTEFKADPETQSFISKGMVPYHKKGEAVNAKEWIQTIKLLPDGKIDYTVTLPVPEGYNYRQGSRTTFLTMPSADGYSLGNGKTQMFDQKQLSSNIGKTVTVIAKDPADVFTIQILSKDMFYSNIGKKKQMRIGLHPSKSFMNMHFIFDFNPKAE